MCNAAVFCKDEGPQAEKSTHGLWVVSPLYRKQDLLKSINCRLYAHVHYILVII